MTQGLYLGGAGDGALEILHIIDDINKASPQPKYKIIGVLAAEKPTHPPLEVFPWVDVRDPQWKDRIDRKAAAVITQGNPRLREIVFKEIKEVGLQLPVLIHPQAVVSETCTLAEGCVIGPQAVLSYGIELGANCYVSFHVSIGHYSRVGMHSFLSPGSRLGGTVHCGRNLFLGMNAVIIPRLQIGSYVTVSAGALVANNVDDGAKVIGSKSRILKL